MLSDSHQILLNTRYGCSPEDVVFNFLLHPSVTAIGRMVSHGFFLNFEIFLKIQFRVILSVNLYTLPEKHYHADIMLQQLDIIFDSLSKLISAHKQDISWTSNVGTKPLPLFGDLKLDFHVCIRFKITKKPWVIVRR